MFWSLASFYTHPPSHPPSNSFHILWHNWKTTVKYVRWSRFHFFFSIETSFLESSIILPSFELVGFCYSDIFFLFCVRFLYQDLNSLFLFGLVYPFWYSTSSSRLLRNWYKRDFSFSRVLTHLEMLISYNTFNLQVGNYSPQIFESIIPLAVSKGMASINVEKSDAILIRNLLWNSFFFSFSGNILRFSLSLVFES